MKIVKWFLIGAFSLSTMVVMAQSNVTIKVTNVRSSKGKVLIATDKGHYSMANAKKGTLLIELKEIPLGVYKLNIFHDENDNFKLDREAGEPIEDCIIADIEVKDDTKWISIELKSVGDKVKK